MGNFSYIKKKYYSFTIKEFKALLITAIVAGFVVSFRLWGSGSAADVAAGIGNLILGIIFAMIALYIHIWAQKLMAIKLGAVADYTFWKLGLFLGAIVTFLSNGFIPLFFTGALNCKGVPALRIGKFPPRFKQWDLGILSFAGPFANMLLVLLLKPFYIWTGLEILKYFIMVNLFVMIWSMLPLPLFHGVKVIEGGRTSYDFKGGTVGFNIFIASRWLFVFFFSITIIYSLLVMIAGIFSLLISIFIAILITIVFYMQMEHGK